MTVRRGRVGLTAILVTLMLGAAAPAAAHTREKLAIDELSTTVAASSAATGARLTALEERDGQIERALDERREHGRRLQERCTQVETNVEAGLRALRDTLGKAVDAKLAAMAESVEAGTADRARLRGDLTALTASLGEFRTALSAHAAAADKRLAELATAVDALKAGREKDRADLEGRLSSLLQVVSQENERLRAAIGGGSARTGTAGAGQGTVSPSGRFHLVAPGENLYGIARRYNLSFDEIKRVNPQFADDSATIRPGDRVNLP